MTDADGGERDDPDMYVPPRASSPRSRRHLVGLAAILGCLLSSISVAGPALASVTSTVSIAISPSTAIPGQRVRVTGGVRPIAVRTVKLQKRQGTTWHTLSQHLSTRSGAYAFAFAAPTASAKYRVFAPASGRYAAATSAIRSLTVRPAPVTALSATADDGTVHLHWTLPAGPRDAIVVARRSGTTQPTLADQYAVLGGSAQAYDDADVSRGDTLTYAIFARSGGLTSTPVSVTVVVPQQPPPAPVTGLAAALTDHGTVALSWTAVNDPAVHLDIARATGSVAPTTSQAAWVASVPAGTTAWEDSFAAAGTTYSYSVFVVDDATDLESAAASVTITTPPPAPLPPVLNLTAVASSNTEVDLAWTGVTDDRVSSYLVRRAVGQTAPTTPTSGTYVAKVGAAQTSYQDAVQEGTTYSYAIFSTDDLGTYSPTATVTVTTPRDLPFGPVSGLSVTAIGSNAITLGWQTPDPAVGLTGITVRRALGAVPPATVTSGTLVAELAGTATTVTDPGLAASTQYSYAVFAHGSAAGDVQQPAVVTTSTRAVDHTAPGPVTALTASATASRVTLAWTNPADADLAGVTIRRAVGTTAPASATSGATVADVAAPQHGYVDTAVSPGTTYSYALFAYDPDHNLSAAATVTVAVAPVSTGSWTMPMHDPEHRIYAPDETTLNADNITGANGIGEEWSIDGRGASWAVRGGVLYQLYSTETMGSALSATDLATGTIQWTLSGVCGSGPVVVTDVSIVLGCGGAVQAYDLTTHALQWTLADTDPGQGFTGLSVAGGRLIAWGGQVVAAYRLTDGQRYWQHPDSAGIVDVAATSTTVVTRSQAGVQALSLATGASMWSVADTTTADTRDNVGVDWSRVVISGGSVYTNFDRRLQRLSLTNGAVLYDKAVGSGVYQLLGADDDRVYFAEATFEWGGLASSALGAANAADGTSAWSAPLSAHAKDFAVAGDLVWMTQSDYYRDGRFSQLVAFDRVSGARIYDRTYDDNMYGESFSVASGKVVFEEGGSCCSLIPRTLRVFGLGGAVPSIGTRVLHVARTGTAYSEPLTGQGAGLTWSLRSGSLPAGLSLQPAGSVGGTPTATGLSRFTVRATASNGRFTERELVLDVEGPGDGVWGTADHDAGRTAYLGDDPSLGVDLVGQVSSRWTAAADNSAGGARAVAVAGGRAFTTSGDGAVQAWSTAGDTANRPTVWRTDPAQGTYSGSPTVSGTKVLVRDSGNHLVALDAASGAKLWSTPADYQVTTDAAPLVTGSLVIVSGLTPADTQHTRMLAFHLSDGTAAWDSAAADLSDQVASSDGTRAFTESADCQLVAVNLADGSTAWTTPFMTVAGSCFGNFGPPAVAFGKVYSYVGDNRLVVNAATGAVVSRFVHGNGSTCGYFDCYPTPAGNASLAGGLWIYGHEGYDGRNDYREIVATDPLTGEVLWRDRDVSGVNVQFAVVGDLVLVLTDSTTLVALDRTTGARLGTIGTITPGDVVVSSVTVVADRIYLPTSTGIRVFGLLS